MNYYIYKIVHLETGRYYIGRRESMKSIQNDPYMGSGILIKKAIKKYGKLAFSKLILEVCKDRKSLIEAEQRWIDQTVVDDYLSYNIDLGGRYSSRNSTTNEKISKIIKEKHWTTARREQQSLICKAKGIVPPSQKGIKRSDETIARLRASQKGKIGTFTGRTHSLETRQFISQHNKHLGKKPPNQTGKRMWNNGIKNTMATDCPGPTWQLGRLQKI